MSIAKRICEATEKLHRGDFEAALIPVCIALDTTSKKLYRKSKHDNSIYKKFVKENLVLITAAAFGGSTIGTLRLKYSHPSIRSDANGVCTFEEIVYHAVRCGLVHDSELPDNLEFRPGKMFAVEKSSLVLPAELITGLMMAVVCCTANTAERVPEVCGLDIAGAFHSLNRFWGRPERLRALLAAANAR